MAGRNYHSYRGRTPKWKILLSIVLVLIIVASLGFLALQRYIVYDETGTPHFLLPGSSEVQPEHPQQPHASLVVEEPEVTEEEGWQLYLAPSPVVTEAEAQTVLAAAARCGGAAVTVKDESGKVYFRTPTAISSGAEDETAGAIAALVSGTDRAAARGCTGPAMTLKADTGRVYFRTPTAISSGAKDETAEALALILAETDHTAARLVCFADPKAANSDVEGMGLKNTGGYIFYDGNNRQWLDPAKEAARTYLVQLAVECARLGFDEIILSGVSYPTEGKLHKIAYGETPQDENLGLFLEEVAAALEEYGVTLTVEMTAEGILIGTDDGGLTVETAAKYAQRICAVTEGAEMENLATIVGRYGESVEFVPILTELPFGYEESAILAGTNE